MQPEGQRSRRLRTNSRSNYATGVPFGSQHSLSAPKNLFQYRAINASLKETKSSHSCWFSWNQVLVDLLPKQMGTISSLAMELQLLARAISTKSWIHSAKLLQIWKNLGFASWHAWCLQQTRLEYLRDTTCRWAGQFDFKLLQCMKTGGFSWWWQPLILSRKVIFPFYWKLLLLCCLTDGMGEGVRDENERVEVKKKEAMLHKCVLCCCCCCCRCFFRWGEVQINAKGRVRDRKREWQNHATNQEHTSRIQRQGRLPIVSWTLHGIRVRENYDKLHLPFLFFCHHHCWRRTTHYKNFGVNLINYFPQSSHPPPTPLLPHRPPSSNHMNTTALSN